MPELSTKAPDPLARVRAVTRRTAVVAGVAVVVAGIWAAYLPEIQLPVLPTPATVAAPVERPIVPLDLAAFQTPVWTIAEPIKEAAAPPPPPPTPPLKVQLLGILKEGDVYRAVLFDPDNNKIRIISAGEDVQGRRVEQVAATSATIGTGATRQVLAIKAPGALP